MNNKPQLADLIKTMGMETEADAGDFAAITTAAHAQSVITPRLDKVGGKESLAALLAAGHDAVAIVTELRADVLGDTVYDTLIQSGVDWDDDLCKLVLGGLVAKSGPITQAVADTLINLSMTKSSPAQDAGVDAGTVALDFQIAWIVHLATQTTQADLTTADGVLAASIATEKTTLDAAQAVYDQAVVDANAIHSPVAGKHNAVSAWLQVGEFLTAAEWQTEADELLASADGNGSHGV